MKRGMLPGFLSIILLFGAGLAAEIQKSQP